jgi:hypothetical protein
MAPKPPLAHYQYIKSVLMYLNPLVLCALNRTLSMASPASLSLVPALVPYHFSTPPLFADRSGPLGPLVT